MIQSKLLQFFQILSPDDLRQIQKMLKSPYFTSNKNLQILFKILRNGHPQNNSNSLKKEKVFSKIFPIHPYSDIKLRNLMSELRQIIEKHLILKQLDQDPWKQKRLLTKSFIEKGKHSLMEKMGEKLQKEINEQNFHTSDFYLSKYESLLLLKDVLHTKDFKGTASLIQEAEKTLDDFYTFSKVRLNIELKDLSGFASLNENLQNEYDELEKNISYQLYKNIKSLLEEDQIELFHSTIDLLFNQIIQIDKQTQMDIFSFLINYAIRQMRFDDKKYNAITFKLYQQSIEHQIITTNLLLIEAHFLNIVIIGSKEKEFKWVHNFINSHIKKLSPSIREDLSNMSFSYLHFHKKEFQKAIDFIIQYNFTSSVLSHIAKIHLLRCYYELFLTDDTYFDLLIAQSHNYEKYSQRNSDISQARKEAILVFTRFIRKLANLRTKGKLKKAELAEIQSLLNQHPAIISRSWLIEKLTE